MVTLFLLFVSGVCGFNYTVSGFGSGANFAHQLHIAHSGTVIGVGLVAPSPYYCAMGSLVRAATACRVNSYLLNLESMILFTTNSASSSYIDDVKDIGNDRVFILSGLYDRTVPQSTVSVTLQYYQNFITNSYKIDSVFNLFAGHGWVTDNAGGPCWASTAPFIINCGYDMASYMLTFLVGNLKPKTSQIPTNLMSFDQSDYVDVWQAGLSTRGFVYLPQYCVTNNDCFIHLAFHGCRQNYDMVGDVFVRESGLNEWAESNRIIVIYPQTVATSVNLDGCWDYWGYTGSNYVYQNGLQINAVNQMAIKPPHVTWSN